MALYQFGCLAPDVDATAWVAETAQVIGQVWLAARSSVWFGVVISGDTGTVTVGAGSNIQDNSVLHADHHWPLVIGEHVTVGHQPCCTAAR